MTTPLIMLALMTGPYAVARLVKSVAGRKPDQDAGALGLALLFAFTGIGHFIQTEQMSRMAPDWIPFRELLVYLTGILEFSLAAGFVARRTRRLTGWIAAAVVVLFFPVNVYAAINRVPMGGHEWGPVYLLVRGPVQLAVLLWIYRFAIKPTDARI